MNEVVKQNDQQIDYNGVTTEKSNSTVTPIEQVVLNSMNGSITRFNQVHHRSPTVNVLEAKRSFLRLQTRSIVKEMQNKWLTRTQEKYRKFLMLLAIIIIAYNTTHDALMMFRLLPVPNTYPLISGQMSTIIIIFLADGLFFLITYLGLIYRTDYTDFEQKWKSIGLSSQDPFLDKMLQKTAQEIAIFSIVAMIGWTVTLSVFSWIVIQNDWDNGIVPVTMITVHISSYFFIPLFAWAKFYSLYTCSMIIRSVFTMIGKRILNHPDTFWNTETLRFYRQMYSRTIELTESSDNIWSRYLSIFYPMLNLFAIIIVYYIISGPVNLFRYAVLGILDFTAFWSIFFTNRYIIGINVEAASIYNIVYGKSLIRNNVDYMIEASLFLERIGREDVGYSYEGLFVYSPRLMTSILTLAVTIIIAFPSFVSR
uniref:Gustatory receptor n=1 Tax=Tetranychus urticae TaxID=32264 RepID=T1KL29_TETUR